MIRTFRHAVFITTTMTLVISISIGMMILVVMVVVALIAETMKQFIVISTAILTFLTIGAVAVTIVWESPSEKERKTLMKLAQHFHVNLHPPATVVLSSRTERGWDGLEVEANLQGNQSFVREVSAGYSLTRDAHDRLSYTREDGRVFEWIRCTQDRNDERFYECDMGFRIRWGM